MPRDPQSLKIHPWADSGDRIDPDDSNLAVILDRDYGWPLSFSQPGGNVPRRTVFNQLLREITGMLTEINARGILEYSTQIDYLHPSYVVGADGNIYKSRRINGPSSDNVGAPNTAGNGQANWQRAIAETISIPVANENQRGIIELADTSEVRGLAASDKAISPARLNDLTATESRKGILETASDAEAKAMASRTKIIVPGNLDALRASHTERGLVEKADNSEADGGVDDERFMTSAKTKRQVGVIKKVVFEDFVSNGGNGWEPPNDRTHAIALGERVTNFKGFELVINTGQSAGRTNRSGSVYKRNPSANAQFSPTNIDNSTNCEYIDVTTAIGIDRTRDLLIMRAASNPNDLGVRTNGNATIRIYIQRIIGVR